MVTKERLDKLLVDRGIARSRERARAMIMAGKVVVEGKRTEKPGTQINVEARLRVQEGDSRYVSRGGEKIEGALKAFAIDPGGMVVMDVGASTGGFTDCILQKGAEKVYAVDVGYGQLAWRLQKDARVVNLERKNIRYLRRAEVKEEIDLAVIDTSFISIEKFLPHLLGFLKKGGAILGLIKPQFEVGKGEVGRGGVVRDETLHKKVIDRISHFSRGLGLRVLGVAESPLLGPKGNKEFFIYLKKESEKNGQTEGAQTG
ncbi:MAG TPA: TlyA family RNA methyltransferase [Thermodesulfobacteriota bacterium]|nr:TlyA family RNA methyltransferase [Thermodesulfobacteriota bacterium]